MVELTLKKIPLNSPPVPPWILSLGLRWATLGFRKFGGSTKGQMTMTLSLRRQHCLVRKYSIHEDHESKTVKTFRFFFFFTFLNVLDILSNSLNLYVLKLCFLQVHRNVWKFFCCFHSVYSWNSVREYLSAPILFVFSLAKLNILPTKLWLTNGTD